MTVSYDFSYSSASGYGTYTWTSRRIQSVGDVQDGDELWFDGTRFEAPSIGQLDYSTSDPGVPNTSVRTSIGDDCWMSFPS